MLTEDEVAPKARRTEISLKNIMLVCSTVVIPGIIWATSVQVQLNDLTNKVIMINAQIDSDRRNMSNVLTEMQAIRQSIESLRSDILQRITRVETKLEEKK